MPQVALTLPTRHPVGDVLEQRLAELPHGLGGELQLAVGAPLEVAGLVERALQLGQGLGVDRRLVTELALELVEVDVIHPGPAVGLRELLREVVEVGQVLEYAGPVAEPETLLAAELLGAAPVLARAQGAQVVVELGEGLHQLRAAEGLCCQGIELVALLLRHRVAHALRSGRALGEGIHQLVDVLRVLREEVAVLVHEVGEVLVGVLTATVLVQQLVEVAQHLVDRGTVLVGGVLERLLHALETLVEQLPAEQVLDLLVVGASLGAAPVVGAELLDRRRRARREVLQLHLGEGPLSVVHLDVARQLLALVEHRPVEELADLLHGPVQVVLAEQLAALVRYLTGEVVQAALGLSATTQELAHGALR